MRTSLTYADAGVDIDKANSFVNNIKKIAKQTHRTGVIGDIGGFGGMFSINTENYERPVLVSSTDGVGTKLKIASMMDKHDTIGIDLVAMCVNDICVQGAKPLFFLDYISMGKFQTEIGTDIIKGISRGCMQAKCVLIGGETAEMPGFYTDHEYDLAGFAVGLVDNSKIIDGSEIRGGHKLIGIASSGLHSNGYSLAIKICFEILKLKIDTYIPELDKTIGQELLTPTKIYSETIRYLIKDLKVHGLVHVTGGGIPDNILRVIPEPCNVRIFQGTWKISPIFRFLQNAGNISDHQMMKTFNNGIGLIVIAPESSVQEILDRLNHGIKENAWLIGEVVAGKQKEPRLKFV